MSDGLLGKCKECAKKDSNNNAKSISYSVGSYDRTEKGVIRVIYKTQRASSKKRGHQPPAYSKEFLKGWLYENDYKKIYNKWVESGYLKNKKPSVDRKDDFKPYSTDNIRLGTWEDNVEHQRQDTLKGIGTSGRKCKPILQYDKNGCFVAEYVSFSSACRVVGYSIERSLKSGKPDRKNKYIWRYKNNNEK